MLNLLHIQCRSVGCRNNRIKLLPNTLTLDVSSRLFRIFHVRVLRLHILLHILGHLLAIHLLQMFAELAFDGLTDIDSQTIL